MKAFLLLVVLAGAVAAVLYFFVFDKQTPSSEVRIVGVSARLSGPANETILVVDVDLEPAGAMPPVGPHVIVAATCDGRRDEVAGDLAVLNNAPAGEQRSDTIIVFSSAPFDGPPNTCTIDVRSSDGGATARVCLALGTQSDC